MFSESSEGGRKPFVLTTSWDDGHPLDFRVAELLAKHGLPGTFYVPLKNVRPTISPTQVRELSQSFEIGAHTVNHLRLKDLEEKKARREIVDCKDQLEDILGRPCPIFCFPGGSYSTVHLQMLNEAGFAAVRTVELLSLTYPQEKHGVAIIPTTIQAFPHDYMAYLRNCAKRCSFQGIGNLASNGLGKSWPLLAEGLLKRAALRGGIFHLWGHSWEVEERGQWEALDGVLALMAEYRQHALFSSNMELCGNEGRPARHS